MRMQRLGDEEKAWASVRGSENSSAWTRYMCVDAEEDRGRNACVPADVGKDQGFEQEVQL